MKLKILLGYIFYTSARLWIEIVHDVCGIKTNESLRAMATYKLLWQVWNRQICLVSIVLNNLYLNDENKEARNDSNLKTTFICL